MLSKSNGEQKIKEKEKKKKRKKKKKANWGPYASVKG